MVVLRGSGGVRRAIVILVVLLAPFLFFTVFMKNGSRSNNNPSSCPIENNQEKTALSKDGKLHTYDKSSPLIFVGGFPRSGTTLIRAMLDSHPDVRCGEETRVVPKILQMAAQWNRSEKESTRLREAGINDEVLGDAVTSFILEIIVKHGEPAPRLCNKDPFTLKYGVFLLKLFPQAKFIFMIRDGRAVVHSMITRKVTVTGFDKTDYRQCLKRWSNSMKTMMQECEELGPNRCLKVKYEDLVLHPRSQMQKILNYLEIPWIENVMHHEQYINKPGGVSLSNVERSSDQVVKPINVEALIKWVGAIPKDVVRDMKEVAPMLEILGYDPAANPPKYGLPDHEVATNMNEIVKNPEKWFKTAQDVLLKSKQKPKV